MPQATIGLLFLANKKGLDMELEAKLSDLTKTIKEHREVLATEEAAKNALVMPFIQSLGYNVFSPSEVIPEFTADVGTKKGEKVDYAILSGGKVSFLIECKPANSDLTIQHASQLFRYFSVTEARIAILTNGVIFQFYSDIERPNQMDEKPFFVLDMERPKKSDFQTLESFTKESFDIERIVAEAGHLKMQSLVGKELEQEFSKPSEEFVRLIAARVHDGRITASIKERFENLILASINDLIRRKVNQRLTSALDASNPAEHGKAQKSLEEDSETTATEIEGYNIVKAICTRTVEPSRITIRDAKSYCAILLDDNNRKTIARMHFNSESAMQIGTFVGKEETRHRIASPAGIYDLQKQLLARVEELDS